MSAKVKFKFLKTLYLTQNAFWLKRILNSYIIVHVGIIENYCLVTDGILENLLCYNFKSNMNNFILLSLRQ